MRDTTAPSYIAPPPRPSPPLDEPTDPQVDATATRQTLPQPGRRNIRILHPLAPPGTQSFAIEHRVQEKKKKFRPFLGADVDDDPRSFVPFVLEASGRLGATTGAFLQYLRTLCHFPISQFRVLVSVISVKHNARMALRWVPYLRHPIMGAGAASFQKFAHASCY